MFENVKTSTLLLLVTSIIYTLACLFIFGWLWGSSGQFISSFVIFAKDYGTLIALSPVLIAVFVAIEQVSSNRNQHIASIKRTFKAERDAIYGLRQLIRMNKEKSAKDFYDLSVAIKSNSETIKEFEDAFDNKIKSVVPKLISWKARIIRNKLGTFSTTKDGSKMTDKEKEIRFKEITSLLSQLEEHINVFEKDLEQYWS